MDTTPKYILMCEKAEEIQKVWTSAWDHLYFDKWNMIIRHFNPAHYSAWQKKNNMIWLPRQDQLQEMLCYTLKFELLEHFRMWYIPRDVIGRYNSMEQLWLAFVMKERYSKVWDETKKNWVNHEKS